MNKNMYSTYDSCAQRFLPPFTMNSDAEAMRMFRNCVQDVQHIFAKNPNDFSLVKLGSFDEKTGKFVTQVEELVPAIDYIDRADLHLFEKTDLSNTTPGDIAELKKAYEAKA